MSLESLEKLKTHDYFYIAIYSWDKPKLRIRIEAGGLKLELTIQGIEVVVS